MAKTTQDIGYLLGIDYYDGDWTSGNVVRIRLFRSGTIFHGFIPSLGDRRAHLMKKHMESGIELSEFTRHKLTEPEAEDPKEIDRGERLFESLQKHNKKHDAWER